MNNLKIALVTGAPSGIGHATAEVLAKAGYTVYGTSRRGGDASGRSFEMLPLDVISDESAAASLSPSPGRPTPNSARRSPRRASCSW